MRFKDRVVIVTGAAGGIGLATARCLAQEGARVAAAVHTPEQADATEAAVRAAGAPDVLVCVCDVADEAAVTRCTAGTVERWGRLDGVVNNAGEMDFKPFADWTAADWQHTLGVDLVGAYWLMRDAFRHMTASGRGGSIVNVSSIHAEMTTPNVATYAAAKAALVSLTRSAAIEGKALGIRANAVLPGAIETPMLRQNPNLASGAETLDPADVGTPESVAAAIAFLLSDDAAFVTGEALRVDGGRLARL